MSSNTHRAYVLAHTGIETNLNNPNQTREATYDPPRHKMVASGSIDYCVEAFENYREGRGAWEGKPHPDAEGDVVEIGEETDAWDREWKEVRW